MANLKVVHPAVGSGGKEKFFVDGKEVTEKEYVKVLAAQSRTSELLESHETPDGHRSACWPMVGSYSLMVHPRQKKKAQELAAAHGCPTEFTHDNRPIFRDRAHRKAYCEMEKCKDRDGGYGDRT